MIYIQNKRRNIKNIEKEFPNAEVIDVTSKGELPFVKFSPFYPVGNIPIPGSLNIYSESVEGIWQGLKVFAYSDIDTEKFQIRNMKGLKRTVRKFGQPLGHRFGIDGGELLDYITARKKIYVPAYEWVLNNKLEQEVEQLRTLNTQKDVVLLDYEINEDISDGSSPLSHASLIKQYILG